MHQEKMMEFGSILFSVLSVVLWSTADCAFREVKPSLCFLPANIGSCKGSIKRYYYDPDEDKCKTFEYSGCDGNENNFNTMPDCQRKCTDVCSLPKKIGPCEGAFTAFYFNTNIGQCEEFMFGGCDANANNFPTMQECKRKCPDVNSIGLEPEDRGETVKYEVRWMFEPKKWDCIPFVYGGAGGNNNNFVSKDECMDNCPINDVCMLPAVSGPCEAAMARWHYDAVTKQCKEFTYGGCLGNDNNFETELACMLRCPKQSICGLPKAGEVPEVESGEKEPKFLERFYYDMELEGCRYFRYSGKGGNANNFKTVEMCKLYCPVMSRCAEDVDGGDGNKPVPQWYYDIEDRRCRFFVYYGGGGTNNRFSLKKHCQEECLGCRQKKDPGPCHGFFNRWYFDADEGRCKTFIFGGCRGNKNNFESVDECNDRCL